MKEKKDDRRVLLRRRVAKVPKEPGVYRWIDAQGKVMYVGKAKNLKNRMQGYVQDGAKRSAWTEIMVRQIADFEVTVVRSEMEALILESNLIKELQPKYNVLLKDDKGYVYVRISLKDLYPRVDIVRQLGRDGARYFGPFLGSRDTEQALSLLDQILRFRACKKSLDQLNADPCGTPLSNDVPCLDHQIGKCCGLCIGAVTQKEYRERIDSIVSFFRGNFASVKRIAKEKMVAAVQARKFEVAARLRDALRFIGNLEERQAVSDPTGENIDVFGIALKYGKMQVVLLRQRDGKLIEQIGFPLTGEADSATLALEQFLPQYYARTDDVPEIIVLRDLPEDASSLAAWLSEKQGKKVSIVIPERGKKSKLLEMAERNAEEKVNQQFAAFESEARSIDEALCGLQKLLMFREKPRRIECYDISHSSGSATVGSMAVFINGKPKREHYRSFNMKTVLEGRIDDYASLKETLRRRLKYLTDELGSVLARFNADGIVIGKAKKAEQKIIEEISEAHPNDIGSDGISYKDYIVARMETTISPQAGKTIVGFCRLFRYPDDVLCLRSVWVREENRGRKLGHALVRSLLKGIKKGKVYVHVSKDSLLEYYAELGFQPVHTPPPVLQKKLDGWKTIHPDLPVGQILVYIVSKQKSDESFTDHPDLLLIDGGKGQLSAVQEVLKAMQLTIPLASLAKREEEIFVPGNPLPLLVEKDSPARFLLQRLRDEAHRFANFKREKRVGAALFSSKLDQIPSIGPKTRDELLRKFGSADDVIAASDEELKEILTEGQVKELRKRFPSALIP